MKDFAPLFGAIFGGVLVALVGGYFTYKGLKRKASGTVKTSEAETVWAQSQEMREELRLEVKQCKDECAALRTELASARVELSSAKEALAEKTGEIVSLREHVDQLREDLAVALREISRQNAGVHDDMTAIKQEMSLIQGGKV